jgi:hypothetical protein
LESVRTQTAVDRIEQIVIPDHVGVGIGGMYARVRDYAGAVHGQYVHLLCDDDALASPTVVADVEAFAVAHNHPEVILVSTVKGGAEWPMGEPWPPQLGWIDLGCVITRADVWKAHVTNYGQRYEGDFDFMSALHAAGRKAAWCDLLFSVGGVSRGEPEAVAA